MIVTTTATLQDRKVNQYLGLVTGETIGGAMLMVSASGTAVQVA